MHDVTEGGILGAVYEMATASGCGVLVHKDLVPTGEVQKQVCDMFEIDPHFSVGAGSMVIAVKAGKANSLLKTLQTKGVKATVVGSVVKQEEGMTLIDGNSRTDLVHPGTDPYWKAFYEAFAKGLK
jgi:hydrogenase expression/formation protein HypE